MASEYTSLRSQLKLKRKKKWQNIMKGEMYILSPITYSQLSNTEILIALTQSTKESNLLISKPNQSKCHADLD